MKYAVVFAAAAENDLASAYLWIAAQAPEAAIRWHNGILDAVLTLVNFPERCPNAPESETFDHPIRQLIYGHRPHAYRILFDVSGRTVRILHIRHGARDHLTPESE